jgi:GNAT superfamily N-acetyltransferase
MTEVESKSMLKMGKARSADAATLAGASERAFNNDIHYGAPGPGPGGPPGYRSPEWQARMMRIGDYHKIVFGDQIIGGVIVFRKASREYDLGRIFIDPEYQNRGLGTQVMTLLWKAYPLAKRWTLGTPAWNKRTRHFYAKVGFQEIGTDGHDGILFERRIEPKESARVAD